MRYICTSIVATLVLAGTSFAATINVPADYNSIQAAIDAAQDGDVIEIAAGVYGVTSAIQSYGKAITIRGETDDDGLPAVTIDGQHGTRVVYSHGDASDTFYENLVIANGQDGDGAGMRLSGGGAPHLINCTFRDNHATNGTGGGLYILDDSSPVLTHCRFENNQSDPLGGGVFIQVSTSPTFEDCTFTGNVADNGGAVYSEAPGPEFTRCNFSGNESSARGAGLYLTSSSPELRECVLQDNHTDGIGGGILCTNQSSPRIISCVLEGNSAERGGALFCFQDASIVVSDCMISQNTATNSGGAFWTKSSITLSCTHLCANSTPQIEGNYVDNGAVTITEACPAFGACCTNFECVMMPQTACDAAHGDFQGDGSSCDDAPCSSDCLGDVNHDGEVAVNDILTVIANWGPCP